MVDHTLLKPEATPADVADHLYLVGDQVTTALLELLEPLTTRRS